MIGKRFYKGNYNHQEYAECAIWCNSNNATIEDKGEYYECVAIPAPALEEVKERKKAELTSSRDAEEYHNVTTDIGTFEFDTLSQTRLSNAMNSMGDMQTREWTTADHTIVTMYKTDFQNIFKVAAERSDENFAKLNNLKQLVNNATSVAEVEAIKWEGGEHDGL